MKLTLINPRTPESFWSFKWAVNQILPGKRALNPPLGLATLAALTPPHWDVTIVDENVESVPLDPEADLVGIGGMAVQAPRQRELIRYYRERGYRVVVGGASASLTPEKYEGLADTVVSGEAEYIWPQFCRDFEAGCAKALYKETGTVDLKDSPVPRFDLLKLKRYANATLQYSRGCPYTCEFCDIIVMFGRKPRMKSPAQIGCELDALREAGVSSIFFVDDNMIGNKKKAKELFAFIAQYQDRHGRPFSFGTEVSINLAQDEELMALMRAANFNWVFIGIESPDPASLAETGKTQNLREDMLVSIKRIYSKGMEILAGFIIGFDNDTPATFEAQYRFIRDSGIQTAMIGQLFALPKTPLYERLEREGRIREIDDESDNTRARSNVVHKTMSDDLMSRRYADVYRRLLSDEGIAARIRNKVREMGRTGYRGGYTANETAGLLWRLLTKGILPGGPSRIWHFARSFPAGKPWLAPTVVADWIAGLSMRAFARDHLWAALAPDTRRLEAARAAIARMIAQSEVWIGRQTAELPSLNIHIGNELSLRFARKAVPEMKRLMRKSRTRLILAIENIPDDYVPDVEKLLRRLSKYGDRVFVRLSDATREQLSIDLSRFNLVLMPALGK
ncbi:MAG TPA: radical SAM protein [Rhizomicrobium sp.]|nr:radical SAM protein [Rhizomicrobium sp.]